MGVQESPQLLLLILLLLLANTIEVKRSEWCIDSVSQCRLFRKVRSVSPEYVDAYSIIS